MRTESTVTVPVVLDDGQCSVYCPHNTGIGHCGMFNVSISEGRAEFCCLLEEYPGGWAEK